MARHPMVPAVPFLKWAGGKRQLASRILQHFPARFGTYYEPMLGAGAVFFELVQHVRTKANYAQPRHELRVHLNDALLPLMITWEMVKTDLHAVLEHLQVHAVNHCEKHYYETRAKNFKRPWPEQEAADFIYINRTCWNGVCRFNQKGFYNVPHGRYKNPRIIDGTNLRAVQRALQGVRLTRHDFDIAVKDARKGDVVYFDPPYWPVSKTADFTSFTADGFDDQDQIRLRDLAMHLKDRGVHVILSNSDVPQVRKLYRRGWFKLHPVKMTRAINSKTDARGHVGELIIT